MKPNAKYTKEARVVAWQTLLVMTIFAAAFFIMPSAVLSANLSVSISPDGQSELGTICTVTAIVESDWCFKSSNFEVSLEVSGANSLKSSKSPEDGKVSWTYKGEKAGTDMIKVMWQIPDCSRSSTGTSLHSTLEKSWIQSGITMEISPDSICIDLESEKLVPCMDARKSMKGTRWLRLVLIRPDGLAVTDINMEKFTLEGVEPERGHAHIKDVDHDGKKDVLLSFWIPTLFENGAFNVLSMAGSNYLKLNGETFDGTRITAKKDVKVQIVSRMP
jgi:hypothetical protein